MKRMTAKEILAVSFRELAEKMPADKITVREIVDNCGYSPATFYRHFKDKYDLIAWDYAKGTEAIMQRLDSNAHAWRVTLLEWALRFQSEKEYLANLLLHTTGQDAFIRYMTDINHEAMRTFIVESNGGEAIDQKTDLLIRNYCLGTVMLSYEWIIGMHKITAEELAEVYAQALPESLKQYLIKE